jgi:hypothetical protein
VSDQRDDSDQAGSTGGNRGDQDPATGRFLHGNAIGKRGGNPQLRRLGAAQAAVRRATRPADVVKVLDKLRDAALAGDVAAAGVWLRRVLGREREAPDTDGAPLPFVLDVATAAGVVASHQRLSVALAAGELTPTQAAGLLQLLDSGRRAVELLDLEQRIAHLERQARTENR